MTRMSSEQRMTGRAPGPEAARPLASAMRRGAELRCPACGRGRMFRAYLEVVHACGTCGEELHHHRADDAPPYFTIVLVGHMVVAGALALEQALAPPSWLHFVLWLPLTLALSLLMLPRIKGALVGLQWAHRMHGFGSGPDPASSALGSQRPRDP